MWDRKSDATPEPASSAPAAPMPEWRYRLNFAMGAYLIGRIVGLLADLAMQQGRLLERNRVLGPGYYADRDVEPGDRPAAGYFCSATGGPACAIALENPAESIPPCEGECHLGHRTFPGPFVDLTRPETD